MIYEDRSIVHTPSSARDLVDTLRTKFASSERSRIVMRFLLSANTTDLQKYISDMHKIGGTISYYPDRTPDNPSPFLYITYSENKKERCVEQSTANQLAHTNEKYIRSTLASIGR